METSHLSTGVYTCSLKFQKEYWIKRYFYILKSGTIYEYIKNGCKQNKQNWM